MNKTLREQLDEVKEQVLPIGERILVKKVAMAVQSKGIFITSDKEANYDIGDVVRLGDGKYSEVRVGDRILYPRYAGTLMRTNGEDFTVLNETDVFAFVDK